MNQMLSPLQIELHRQHRARQAKYDASAGYAERQKLFERSLAFIEHAHAEEERRRKNAEREIKTLRDELATREDREDDEWLRSRVWSKVTKDIIRAVAKAYGVMRMDILSTQRTRGGADYRVGRNVIMPRQVAMYLSKTITNYSYLELGRQYGKDHTTILHAVRKITAMMEADPDFRAKVEELRAALNTGIALPAPELVEVEAK